MVPYGDMQILHQLLWRRRAGVGRLRHVRLVPQRRDREQGEVVVVRGREAAAAAARRGQPGVLVNNHELRRRRRPGRRQAAGRGVRAASHDDQGGRPQVQAAQGRLVLVGLLLAVCS